MCIRDSYGTVGGGAIEHRAIEEARKLLRERKNLLLPVKLKDEGMQCGGSMTLFFEYIEGKKEFVLFGGGHVGRALAAILTMIGFHVTILDMRSEVKELLAEKENIDVVLGDYEDISVLKEILERTDYTFIATHGHQYDGIILKQLLELKKDFTYLGLIGSKTKVKTLFGKLEKEGLKIPDYVYAPVGIRIGGDSAEEIAVSIAAEVIAVKYGVNAEHMRDTLRKKSDVKTDIPEDNIPRLV